MKIRRKSAQIIVLLGVLTIVLVIAAYLYRVDTQLQTQVIGPTTGYQPPSTGYQPGYTPSAQPPASTQTVGNLQVYTFVYNFSQAVVLNSLPLPQITSFSADVRWVADVNNPQQVTLSDPNAVSTYFFAPDEETELLFKLEYNDGTGYQHIANFVIKVWSPLTQQADFNDDGRFTFADLLNLLQNWNSFGADATKILAIVLSEYE